MYFFKKNNPVINVFQNIDLDSHSLTLYKDAKIIPVQRKFLEVLRILITNKGKIVSHEELIDRVWAGNYYVGKYGIIRAINSLRRILCDENKPPKIILSIYGKGYVFNNSIESPLSRIMITIHSLLGLIYENRKPYSSEKQNCDD